MKLYDKRDIEELDRIGEYYYKHVSAMTDENLHSKTDIAAELAWRDYLIELNIKQINKLKDVVQYLEEDNGVSI